MTTQRTEPSPPPADAQDHRAPGDAARQDVKNGCSEPAGRALREALAELVALKDLKDAGFGAHDTASEDDYLRRKPIAWANARAALAAATPPVQPTEAGREATSDASDQ